MKQIKFNLSQSSIKSAIKQLEKYKKDLSKKTNLLVEALTAKGIDIAKFNVQNLGAFYTGELEASIGGYFSPSLGVGIIYAGSFYALWVEFGTGLVGQQSPHPEAGALGYVYDVNSHGSDGWTYFNERDGKYHFTTGMPSRPFLYLTIKELDAICEKVAKAVFK